MYIKEIELNNFRVYKGKNRISLLPAGNKNIIVVSGQNGFGKTTFLISLVWCLYGQRMTKVDDLYLEEIKGKGNYTKYIAGSLNCNAKENGEVEFSVMAEFVDVEVQGIRCDVTIKRSYNTDENVEKAEKIKVEISGQLQELVEDLGEEFFINDYILPIEIAKFFFFDSEKIDSLAGPEKNQIERRQNLSMGYSEVLGIKKYEDLKKSLEELHHNYLKKAAKPEDEKELNQLEADIKNNEISIAQLENDISRLKEEKNTKSKDLDEIQIKLIREGDGISLEELEKLKAEQVSLEEKRSNIQEELKKLYDLIPFALAGQILVDVSEQLKNEGNLFEQKYEQEKIQEKTDRIREDIEKERENQKMLFDIKIRDFYEDQIIKLVRKYFCSDMSEQNKNLKILHGFSSQEAYELNQLISSIKHDFKDKIFNLYNKDTEIKDQIDKISRRIREAERHTQDTRIADLRKKREEFKKQVSNYDREIGKSEEKIASCEEKIKTYRKQHTLLLKKIEDAVQFSEKERKTKQLIDILEKFTTEFKKQKKESLQRRIINWLDKLLNKKDFIKKVEVDVVPGEDIDIILYGVNEQRIDQSSLSKGERQIYISALFSSLVNESKVEFPVFIDSPLQKFDKIHAENIIRNFYPNISKQVVIFPLLDTELTAERYNLLKQHICKTYSIQHNKTTYSSEFLNNVKYDANTTY